MGEGTISTEGEFGNERAPFDLFGEEVLIALPNVASGGKELF